MTSALQGASANPDEWNDDLDRQHAHRESVHRQQAAALRKGGMNIEERSIANWSKPRE